MPTAALTVGAIVLCLSFLSPATTQGRVHGTDLQGRSVSLIPPGPGKIVVLFFIASDCPISNRLLPEMKRVQSEYLARGVRFWFVYPNTTETPKGIRAHLADYALGDAALTDPHGQLAALTGAKITPEAAVMVSERTSLRTVYIGRIDDRYLSISQERPQATRHDLEDALQAAMAGKPPKPPGGPPVGCGLVTGK